jgi:flagellin
MPVISTNTAANTALRYLNDNASQQGSALAKLASGSNITKASDDAAGLAIGTQLGADVAVLGQAATNASQASSILQIADGGLSSISDILTRMKSLAT